jgi:mevalonate kinase
VRGIFSLLVLNSAVPAKNYDFEVITRLPTGAGLGSSASICVGIAGVLLVKLI